MGIADWANLGNELTSADVRRGVINGAVVTPPNGGGSFVYGWNSLTDAAGCTGKYCILPDFDPTAAGGSIRAAIKRLSSVGNTGFSPLLFFGAQGGPPSVNDEAYILGLENADPFRIVLRKGSIVSGIPPTDEEGSTYLRRSSGQFTIAEDNWFHLRLDVLVQPNGDVLLKVFRNDLDVNPVTAPNWEAITGMSDFVDDSLAIASGSAPLLAGRTGYAFVTQEAINRRAAVDFIELFAAS